VNFQYNIFLEIVKTLQKQNVQSDNKEIKRKTSILDLSKYLEKNIRVKFAGGREAIGILKGYDPLLNLVLDNTIEQIQGC
jgi:U6 snRNA-associated Sm-like protein LSm7